jgi:hypothetical protein
MYRVESLPISIPIGRQGENHAMKIEIDCSSFLAEWPQATITAMLRRSVAENPYILVTSIDSSGILTWEPTAHDTGIEGDGQIEIRAVENDVLAKSVTAIVCVERSLTPPEPDTPIDWVENIKSDIAQSVTSAANSASDAAKSATSAQESATAAAGSASAAQSSANAAAGSASAASKSAASAAASADAASGSASAAAQSAAEADTSAKASAASAAEAAGTLDSVKASADAAAVSARAAAESASDAAGSASAASTSATGAAKSATAANTSAQAAAGSAAAAQSSATAAAASKTGAESAANTAKSEADKATASATAADTSAQAAAGSAEAAAQSAQGAAEAAKAEAAKIIQDGAIARTSTWSSQKIVDQLHPEVTASGNPAVIENALEGYPMSIKASWEPKQEGSGTPSPDNVRPIKGRDNVKITANGTEHTLVLPDTIYGGEVDAVTGAGNADIKIATVDGNKIKFTMNGQFWQLPQNSAPNIAAMKMVSHFPVKLFAINTRYDFIFVSAEKIKTYFATIEEFNAYLSAQYAAGTPMQIAYKLAAPESFAATGGGRIYALAGTNSIVTDADTLKVKARAAQSAAAAEIIDDTVIAEGKAWSSKNTVDKLLPMQTVTGNPAVIETLEGYPLELNVSWGPKQEGSGTPSPDNVRPIKSALSISIQRSGMNMLDPEKIQANTYTPYGLNVKYIGNSTVEIKGVLNTDPGAFVIMRLKDNVLSGRGLKFAATTISTQKLKYKLYGLRTKDEAEIALVGDENQWILGTKIDMKIQIAIYAPKAFVEAYIPYSGQSVALTLPRAVCGGTIAPSTGAGQETWGYIASYAGETLPGKWISDRDEYAAGATPTIGAQVAYKLATPVPFTATGGQTALALAGTNVVITDADTVTITAPTPPQTTASAAEAQAAKLDYVAMMADVDVDDLTAVDDAGVDTGMMDMPAGIEGSETDGKQKV